MCMHANSFFVFTHNQINEITLMLYQKIDENNALQRKLDQLNAQNQQLVFQQQLAATLQQQQQQQPQQHIAASPPALAAQPSTNNFSPLNISNLLANATNSSQAANQLALAALQG